MALKYSLGAAVAIILASTSAQSGAQQFFQIGQQATANPTGGTNINVFPSSGNENPRFAIDNVITTKYLNFAEFNTGYIVTPTGGASTIATGINFVTGNDAAERDPATYALYGSNSVVLSSDPAAGSLFSLSNFTLISSGALSLPGNPATDDQRRIASSISFANTAPYTTYLLVFPTVKDSAAANSMQISEAVITGASGALTPAGSPIGGGQLIPEPSTFGMLALGSLVLAKRRRRH